MSFNDPSFLIAHRPSDHERQAAKRAEEDRREAAGHAYRRASWIIALAMIYLAIPSGLEKWHWHVVAGAGLLVVILGIVMAVKGAVKNALLSLLFAGVILPGWVKAAPHVVRVAKEQVQVIVGEWRRIL